jgi:hypothetical protein
MCCHNLDFMFFWQVRDAGLAFVKSFVLAHDANQSVYFHHITTHIPEQIRYMGWLGPFATQGVEHFHSQRKDVYKTLTNRHKGQRGKTCMDHFVAKEEMSYEFRQQDAKDHEKSLIARRQKEKKRVEKEMAKLQSEREADVVE